MANVIDTLFLELGIDASGFGPRAQEAVGQLERMTDAFAETEKQAAKTGKGLQQQSGQAQKSARQNKDLGDTVGKLAKGFAAFFSMIAGSNALDQLVQETAAANVALGNLSQNLGVSQRKLSEWRGMAAMASGSADGMLGSLQYLSMGITRLTTMGDTSLVPFFNAFGVSLLNADGKARDLDKIMLDLADRFGTMDRTRAYNLAKSMGMDEGTINMLLLGRAEMERMLAMQQRLYRSGENDIRISRELTQARSYLNQQWDALRLMMGNALAPVLLKVVNIVSGWMDYLMRHEKTVKNVFEGAAFVIGALLIPVLWSAVTALYALLAPFALVAVAVIALGAAFILLYDDYKTWANGGNSLFDWGAFANYIKNANFSVDNLKKAFVYLLTGYTDWASAANSVFDWLRMKGFIDANGVSLQSLATGFKNLAKDIIEMVAPAFEDLGEIFDALLKRDFSRAWGAAKRLVMRPVNFGLEFTQNRYQRAAGALDVAAGYQPGTHGTASAAVAANGQAARQAVNDFVTGSGQTAIKASRETVRAAQYAMEHALPASAGKCAKYVNDSLRAQGIRSHGHGKDVARNLLNSNQGFEQVAYSKDYVPQDGDVMSIDHGRHGYGHVAIYNAKIGKWVSDFVQHNSRGNTAATTDADYQTIQHDPSRVTIVRRRSPDSARQSALAAGGAGPSQNQMGQAVYTAFRNAGLSDAQARVMTAEVGRENSWNANTIFGYHNDPHKGVNLGMISWQGQRGRNLERELTRQGLMRNGQMVRSQAALDAQARFLVDEMRHNKHGGSQAGNAAVQRFLANPDIDAQTGMDDIGRHFIRWRIDDARYRNAGLRNRGAYLARLNRMLPGQPIAGQLVANGAERASSFVQQGAALREQAQSITHHNQRHIELAINGGIHVHSSAGNIDGTMADASAAARGHLTQLATGLM